MFGLKNGEEAKNLTYTLEVQNREPCGSISRSTGGCKNHQFAIGEGGGGGVKTRKTFNTCNHHNIPPPPPLLCPGFWYLIAPWEHPSSHSLAATGFVYVRQDAHRGPQQCPYNGPLKILETAGKHFILYVSCRR